MAAGRLPAAMLAAITVASSFVIVLVAVIIVGASHGGFEFIEAKASFFKFFSFSIELRKPRPRRARHRRRLRRKRSRRDPPELP